jgi:hypothetical protein
MNRNQGRTGVKRAVATILAAVVTVFLLNITAHAAKPSKKKSFPEIPRMTKEELKEMLVDPDVILLDVRPEQQWKQSKRMLPGAIHENCDDIESWVNKYPKDKTLVLY